MFGPTGDPPFDLPLLALLVVIALVLGVGLLTGAHWSPSLATGVRRGCVAIAIIALAFVMIATPAPNGIVGAARLVFIWPVAALVGILFAAWSWRVGHL